MRGIASSGSTLDAESRGVGTERFDQEIRGEAPERKTTLPAHPIPLPSVVSVISSGLERIYAYR